MRWTIADGTRIAHIDLDFTDACSEAVEALDEHLADADTAARLRRRRRVFDQFVREAEAHADEAASILAEREKWADLRREQGGNAAVIFSLFAAVGLILALILDRLAAALAAGLGVGS